MEFLLAQVVGNDAIPLPETETPVQRFYAGKTVVITGGTGSVGKLLVPKILTNLPGVERLYLMVRAKNVNQLRLRREEIINHTAFDTIRRNSPQLLDKISLIRGELCVPKLGLCDTDIEKLIEETDIVFHLGSTTMFEESFKTSAEINVRGTQDLLELSKKMRKLKVFVHVSTLFANCAKNVIGEEFERPFISAKALVEFLQSMDPNVHHQKPINLGELPNNFVFTKSIAEELIKNENRTLPIVIVRLPLTIPSYQFPCRGFTDHVNSLVGVTMTTYVGLNKSILAGKDLTAEVFPVDMAANAMIAIAWDTAQSKALNDNVEVPNEDNLLIYNLTTSKCNRLPWKLFFGLTKKYMYRYPTIYTIAFPWYILHAKKNWHFILITLLHYIPGYFIDCLTLYLFYKTKYIGYYTKIDMLSRTLTYFTTKAWNVRDGNVRKLLNKMNEDDKELFDFDAGKINWESYFENYILGIRMFVIKDTEDTLALARSKNLQRLLFLLAKIIFIGGLFVFFVLKYCKYP